jgi:threonine/homoserine efflux transporter RhtA
MDATINFVRTMVAGMVWIPYFIFSKRVGRTFVK